MADMPTLRVVPLAKIRAHEKVDPLRVDRLTGRFEEEGIQVNPMMCTEAPGGELVLLDGATRTSALRSIGLEHAVVQLVDPRMSFSRPGIMSSANAKRTTSCPASPTLLSWSSPRTNGHLDYEWSTAPSIRS